MASLTQHFSLLTLPSPWLGSVTSEKCGTHLTEPASRHKAPRPERASWRLPWVVGIAPTTFYPCRPPLGSGGSDQVDAHTRQEPRWIAIFSINDAPWTID